MRKPTFEDVGAVWDNELCDRSCKYLTITQDADGQHEETCAILEGCIDYPAGYCPAVDGYIEDAPETGNKTALGIHKSIIAPLLINMRGNTP